MPIKENGNVGKVMWKVQGFGDEGGRRNDAGMATPSCRAGITPHERDGTAPVRLPCSPSAHAGPIVFSHYGRRSLDGRSGISTGAVSEEGEGASVEGKYRVAFARLGGLV